jgi:hypothetical protein
MRFMTGDALQPNFAMLAEFHLSSDIYPGNLGMAYEAGGFFRFYSVFDLRMSAFALSQFVTNQAVDVSCAVLTG